MDWQRATSKVREGHGMTPPNDRTQFNTSTQRAALTFFKRIPGMVNPLGTEVERTVWRLCWAAFSVYLAQTGSQPEHWGWPGAQIDKQTGFPGQEPWAVLLREAWRMAVTDGILGE